MESQRQDAAKDKRGKFAKKEGRCGRRHANPRKPASRAPSDTRKWLRDPALSPEVTAADRPEQKRPKTSKQSEEWVEVPARKDFRKKKKPNLEIRRTERTKRAHSETVLIKPSEGVSCAAILKSLKNCVNHEELGVTIGGIRETRSKGVLVEVKCSAKDRKRLDSAFRNVVGGSESVRHLVLTVKVEVMDIDPTTGDEEVAEAVRSCLQEEPLSEVKVSITKRPFRGTRKTFVRLEEARALILLKVTHIKIRWVSCRVCWKT